MDAFTWGSPLLDGLLRVAYLRVVTPTRPTRRGFCFWMWDRASNAYLWATRRFLEASKREQRATDPGSSNAVGHQADVDIRPWADGDLPLLQRLMGDPAMTDYLGGPETPEKIRERHQRYCRIGGTGKDRMFVIVVGPERVAAGSVGYWEREWRGRCVWETSWSVLQEFQGQGVATRATAAVVERARAEGKHRFIHAFPSVDNRPSNAICRKVGFTLQGEVEFEYPPGDFMRCNDWHLDLFDDVSEAPST